MSVIEIRPAKRAGARLVIVIAGETGMGKTRTGLELAYGLTKRQPGKIGFLDAENRRGSLEADVFKKERANPSAEPFLIGDLFAPFSPARYAEAIHAFQKAGVEVLIIDSGSHEWEGIGGCTDIADANKGVWNKAKAEHKKFMNALLTCDMHIILCLRAREKSKPERQVIEGREKTVYVDLGLQAITEKNVMYEATASFFVHDRGRSQTILKCPDPLLPFLGRGEGYITDEDGLRVRQWVDGGEALDPKVEAWRNRLISITEKGQAYVDECWGKVPADIQGELGAAFLAMLKASAAEYERQAREAKEGGDDGGASELNDALGTAAAQTSGAPLPEDPTEDPPPPAEPAPPAVKEDAPPPAAANDNAPAPRAARGTRRAGSNPPAPASAEKPTAPANPPKPAAASGKADLF